MDLASLFMCLLAGCGPTVEEESSSSPSTSGYHCDYYTEQEIVLPWDEFSAAAGEDAMLSSMECTQLCEDHNVYYAYNCAVGDLPESGGEVEDEDETGLAGSTSGNGGSTGGSGGETTWGDTGDTTSGGDDTATDPAVEVTVTCIVEQICGVGGRLHTSLQSDGRVAEGNDVGRWLASMAHAEEASVTSFVAIAAELRAHGAPEDLVARALAAADDEVRHAEIMRGLARGRGVEPQRPRFARIEVRELRAIAIENAAEGCVRELWAALEASHQAQHVPDAALAAAMRTIAEDETRHAELALALDAWLRTQLDAQAWADVETARQAAVEELAARLAAAGDPALRDALGLPSPATARRLHSALARRLWATTA